VRPDLTGQKPSQNYNAMLFNVVHNFTNLESMLRYTYRVKIGISKEKFDIVFGLPALGNMLSRLIKLFRFEPHPTRQDAIIGALVQLQDLSRLRNWMVHAGGHALEDANEFLVMLNPNERSVQTKSDFHVFPISAFLDVSRDLNMITAIVAAIWDDDFPLDAQYAHMNFGEPKSSYEWSFKLPGIEKA